MLTDSGDSAGERRAGDRWWSVTLVAVVLVPLVVSAFYLWFAVGSNYFPNTDWAVFELRARDVFHHAVLVGPYSRYGWNHPGPLLFYVLAGPYKLLGSRSISLHITALLVNMVTIAAIGWVAFRRGRLPVVLATLVPVALMTHALGADVLRNPWNPYLPVIPLLLLLLLAWSVAVGDLWMLPVAVAVASFAVQSHVGLALLSLAFLAVAVTGLVIRGVRLRGDERAPYWRRAAKAGAVSVVVFLVLWAPVLYGTFVRHDGNLQAMVDFFRAGRPTAGADTALRALGLQWGLEPEWIFGPRGVGIVGDQALEPHWWAAAALVAAGAATVVAWRRRATDTLWLAVVLAVGFVAAAVAVSNIIEIVYPYLTRWTWVLGVGLGILVLRGAWLAVPGARRGAVLRWAAPVGLVILVVLSGLETVDAIDAGTPLASAQAPTRSISRQVLRHLPPGRGPVLLDVQQAGLTGPGLVLQLERHGIPVKVQPANVVVYGDARTDHGGPYRDRLTMVNGFAAVRAFKPTGPRVAHYVQPQDAKSLAAIRAFEATARQMPPGPTRTKLLKLAREGRKGPAVEIAVYRD